MSFIYYGILLPIGVQFLVQLYWRCKSERYAIKKRQELQDYFECLYKN